MSIWHPTHGTRRVLLATFLGVALMSCWGPESSREKKENAFLQEVEFSNRATGAAQGCLIKKSADGHYCAAGFWSQQANTRVWVLVQPASDPLRVIPNGTFTVRSGDLDLIIEECALNADTAAQLARLMEPLQER